MFQISIRVQPGKIGRRGSSSNNLNHISHFVILNTRVFPIAVDRPFRAAFGIDKGSKSNIA